MAAPAAETELNVDLPALAKRLRDADIGDGLGPLLNEGATMLEHAYSVLQSVPDVVYTNRWHQYRETVYKVAEALEYEAGRYEDGEKIGTPQTALRGVAGALRDSLKPKQETNGSAERATLVH